eukprot:scaffold25704_cov31-Tisochrysis_lutea.AAC.1
MRGALHRLVGGKIPDLGSPIGAARVHPRTVARPAAREDRSIVLGRRFWHSRPVGLDLPAPDLVVPRSSDEE